MRTAHLTGQAVLSLYLGEGRRGEVEPLGGVAAQLVHVHGDLAGVIVVAIDEEKTTISPLVKQK